MQALCLPGGGGGDLLSDASHAPAKYCCMLIGQRSVATQRRPGTNQAKKRSEMAPRSRCRLLWGGPL